MKLPGLSVLILGCVAALGMLPSAEQHPYVVAGGSETMMVIREMDAVGVEQLEVQDEVTVEQVDYVTEAPGTGDDANLDPQQQQQQQQQEPQDQDQADTTAASTPPPRPGCNCRTCWRGCKRRGYNWGICLWKKCHCYY